MDLYVKGEERKSRRGDLFLLVLALVMLFVSAGFFLHTQYPGIFELKYNIDKEYQVFPKESVVVNFSKPVIRGFFGWKLDIYPQTDIDYKFENYNRRLIITPKKNWMIDGQYRISIAGRSILMNNIENGFNFRTGDYPRVIESHPAYGEADVVLDIEDPMKFVFDESLNDFKVKFEINPLEDLSYEVGNKEIILMPKNELKKDQEYEIKVYIKYKDESDSVYREIKSTFFMTKPSAPQVWEKDFTARIEQAKKFTEALIKEGKYIDINLKSQIMTIFENGILLDAYMVSSGKRGMETPQGSFSIANKFPRAWSKKYGLFMPYWMAIVKSGDFGIHELPEWPGGYKEGQKHLGTPVSHGCIRLVVGPAQRVYNFAEVGTPVAVHY